MLTLRSQHFCRVHYKIRLICEASLACWADFGLRPFFILFFSMVDFFIDHYLNPHFWVLMFLFFNIEKILIGYYIVQNIGCDRLNLLYITYSRYSVI